MVGVNSTTTFTPPSLNANVGDIVDFVFVAQNHVCIGLIRPLLLLTQESV